jgi:hypothetical protein
VFEGGLRLVFQEITIGTYDSSLGGHAELLLGQTKLSWVMLNLFQYPRRVVIRP